MHTESPNLILTIDLNIVLPFIQKTLNVGVYIEFKICSVTLSLFLSLSLPSPSSNL